MTATRMPSDGIVIRAGVLAGWTAAALATTAAVAIAAGVALATDRTWWAGLGAATVVSAVSAALSLVVMRLGARGSAQAAAAAWFAASGVRLVVSLGGCLLAVTAGGYPAKATLLLMVPYYLAVLAVEAAVVGRSLWNARV